MSEKQIQLDMELFAHSLETMAFISPGPAEPPLALPPRCRVASISFCGPTSGSIELAASEDFGALLASNLLGCEPSAPEAVEHAPDAIKELLNVFAGSTLDHTPQQGAARYEIGIPRLEPLKDTAPWEAQLRSSPQQARDADGHLVVVRLREHP